MPIIVDEVVVSIEVGDHVSGGAASPPPATDAQNLIVQQCVERVLEVLRQMREP